MEGSIKGDSRKRIELTRDILKIGDCVFRSGIASLPGVVHNGTYSAGFGFIMAFDAYKNSYIVIKYVKSNEE